jgi:hypothetical protein
MQVPAVKVCIHILQAPGFNSCNYEVISWFQRLLSHSNFYRYSAAPARNPAAPPCPPIKFYTDVDIKIEGAGGCFATSSEPALSSATRELIRMSPPSGGHAAAPGGRSRAAAAAAAAAATDAPPAAGWPEVGGCTRDEFSLFTT